jgi:hypothetical protein
VRADARPPALLAFAPLALVLADARAPALLACALLALVPAPATPAATRAKTSSPAPPRASISPRAIPVLLEGPAAAWGRANLLVEGLGVGGGGRDVGCSSFPTSIPAACGAAGEDIMPA